MAAYQTEVDALIDAIVLAEEGSGGSYDSANFPDDARYVRAITELIVSELADGMKDNATVAAITADRVKAAFKNNAFRIMRLSNKKIA